MTKINVQVKPNSKHREETVENDDGSLVAFTKSQAIEGSANEAVAKLPAKRFGVSKSMVRLVRGHTSRHKIFEIDS